MGDHLRRTQGRSYSVEREPHVVDENEPDIRARAANDASVPIEIKVAESWTFEQLEAALVDQLCGRYLRAKEGRHGILLLVHQKMRPRGWASRKDGRSLDFAEVVEHLRLLAKSIAGEDAESPQPEIAVIDVSSCAVAKPKGQKRARTKSRPRSAALHMSRGKRKGPSSKSSSAKPKRAKPRRAAAAPKSRGRRKGLLVGRMPHSLASKRHRPPRK
jgi:hypothetical protein